MAYIFDSDAAEGGDTGKGGAGEDVLVAAVACFRSASHGSASHGKGDTGMGDTGKDGSMAAVAKAMAVLCNDKAKAKEVAVLRCRQRKRQRQGSGKGSCSGKGSDTGKGDKSNCGTGNGDIGYAAARCCIGSGKLVRALLHGQRHARATR
jgi:hypothetical protein